MRGIIYFHSMALRCVCILLCGKGFYIPVHKHFRFHWPDKIRNMDLWQHSQLPMEEAGKQMGWIGHTVRKTHTNTTKQLLSWNLQGKRRRCRPRNTWCRELEADTSRIVSDGRHMEAGSKTSQGQGTLESCCWQSITQEGQA